MTHKEIEEETNEERKELWTELLKWIETFKRDAYLFCNGLTNRYMYFIPICDYDEVAINPDFDAFSFSQIIKDGEVICDLRELIHKPLLCSDKHLIIIPIEFNDTNVPDETCIKYDEIS